jgi:hypothetical protein
VCESLEEFGFEVGKLLGHWIPTYMHTVICEYAYVKESSKSSCREEKEAVWRRGGGEKTPATNCVAG